ncbi:hypothetical protein BDP27DRAFT_50125 [Rhodocollybia butyracea]|uniref:Uncharacterized protein n=1 Tax=Rhodocollybia butyracea TaxID=206335 RepID=A0A9P5PLY3_9AGAR|nr:hypothetical protein BDP27DRAFT_50125 [Rhodocollybia butyracea]
MDPILCEFQYNLHASKPEYEDSVIFRQLRSCLTYIFSTEDERKSELICILRQLAPLRRLACGAIGLYTTDGDVRITASSESAQSINGLERFLLYVQQVDNESGTGGGIPLVEGTHYYIEQVRRSLDTIPEEHQCETNFPAIILTHVGPQIGVSVATFAALPTVETLVSILLNVHSTNIEAVAAGERLVYSLRIATEKLSNYYSTRLFKKNPVRSNINFPYRDFYEINEKKHYFVYEYWEDERREIRKTRLPRTYEGRPFKAASDANIAPQLVAVNEFYDWYMVVMADVSETYALQTNWTRKSRRVMSWML